MNEYGKLGIKKLNDVACTPEPNLHSTHTLSRLLRGELDKEEKGTMVVVTVSTCHLAMWRYSNCLWALCMVGSFCPST